MPKLSTVKDILRMEDGDKVDAFKAKIKTVFKRRSGTSDGGRDWTVQNIICREQDKVLEVVLWNQDRIDTDKEGEEIVIESEDGDGLTANDHEWKGKTKRQLQVRQNGTISWRDGGDAGETSDESEAGEHDSRNEKAPAGRRAELSYKCFAGQAANAMLLAFRGAAYVALTIEKDSKLFATPELINAMTLGIFGALERAGYFGKMPVKPLAGPKPVESPKGESAPIVEPPEPPPAQLPPEDDVPF